MKKKKKQQQQQQQKLPQQQKNNSLIIKRHKNYINHFPFGWNHIALFPSHLVICD